MEPDHKDAWNISCCNAKSRNTARAYIDAVEVLRLAVQQFPNDDGWLDRAKVIAWAAEKGEGT